MSVKVAINGFGRIGRLAFRQLFDEPDFEVVAINDMTSPQMLAHLLKYDSIHRNYKYASGITSNEENGTISVGSHSIRVFQEEKAELLPWKELEIDILIECTGLYTSRKKASAHIKAGAKKVVISAPAGEDLPTIVYGVNHKTLKQTDTIISAASCTTNCLAPVAKALNELAPIKSGIMSTIHAYTSDQLILDGPHRKGDLRRARAATMNIVPNSTGAAKAIGLVIPELSGKLIGGAQRVPVFDGSLILLFAVLDGKVSVEDINHYMKTHKNASFGYTEDEIVSSDVIDMNLGSLFDATQTSAISLDNGNTHVQVAAWYDNEGSYTSQMIRTIKYFSQL